MSDYFRDRIVVVTGASGGIGRAAALHFAGEGALVAAFARNTASLETLVQEFPKRIVAIAGDVSSTHDVSRLFDLTGEHFGDVDILVNCAGMIDPKPLHETDPDAWDRMFAVNVRGTFLTTRAVLPSMLARRSGTIVNVASISGVVGPPKFPGWTSYCASKAAVISMTEALAVEVRDRGVRVNCVSPGSVDTPMWARASGGAAADMTPEEVAETIAFLASERSRPMNGQNMTLW